MAVETELEPLPLSADATARASQHAAVRARLELLLEGEDDWFAALATVACELHAAFEYFHWCGWYRAVPSTGAAARAADGTASSAAAQQQQQPRRELVVGPYQGSHGCLRIAFGRGVCGTAAATRRTQLVPDVRAFPGHIACAASTRSELVVPLLSPSGDALAVLDVDSDHQAAFLETDATALEALCAWLGGRRWRRWDGLA